MQRESYRPVMAGRSGCYRWGRDFFTPAGSVLQGNYCPVRPLPATVSVCYMDYLCKKSALFSIDKDLFVILHCYLVLFATRVQDYQDITVTWQPTWQPTWQQIWPPAAKIMSLI